MDFGLLMVVSFCGKPVEKHHCSGLVEERGLMFTRHNTGKVTVHGELFRNTNIFGNLLENSPTSQQA
jgi:hypothetical protein